MFEGKIKIFNEGLEVLVSSYADVGDCVAKLYEYFSENMTGEIETNQKNLKKRKRVHHFL